jgi:tetratricopeptide (TPR) repeat protein
MKMKFSIGYNQDIKLLDLLDAYKDNIEAFYFPIPHQYLGSGRQIPQKNGYFHEIPEIIKKCNFLNIKSQLLLNATCEGNSGLERKVFSGIIDYIKKLKSLGLKSAIITNPVYISAIKERAKGIEIESSVNCYVKTVEHALYLKNLGVDVLTIDRDINRNLPLIKEIKNKSGLKIKIMLNEGCLRNCPFRNMHYNVLSHSVLNPNRLIDNIFPDRFCIRVYLKYPAKVLSVPFIPPESLPYYKQIADYYKLTTRSFSTPKIEFCLKAYINQDFNGNLLEILDCPGLGYFNYINYAVLKKSNFFRKMIVCTGNSNCNNCSYCNKLIKDAVVINSDFLKGNSKVKENKKALKIYRDILKVSQNETLIYLKLSSVYFNLKRYEKAIATANKVIELNPKEIAAYSLLGFYYEKTKNNEKALELYKKALKIFPDNGNIYLGLGKTYFYIKKYQEAIKNTKKAIALHTGGRNIHFLLGSCYKGIGQYKKAIEELKKEEKLSPEDAQIDFLLAKCYRDAGQIKQANKEFEKGVLKFKRFKKTNFFKRKGLNY